MNVLAVTGASSFLGQALLAGLPADRFSEVRALVHQSPPPDAPPSRAVTTIRGDLLDRASLRDLVTPGCTVVHLAYLTTSRPEEDNAAAARNLLAACRKANVRRLIHCSTAAVTGAVADDVVTEATPCRPTDSYEAAKFAVEQLILESSGHDFEVTVVRPTAVFGPRGKNLLKLTQDLVHRPAIVSYFRSCLQGRRRMNLVHIDNVTAALQFLIDASTGVDGEVFIVSDDDSPLNNYQDVERILAHELGVPPYLLPPVEMPDAMLSMALRVLGRSNTNPKRVYDCGKLVRAGLNRPMRFEQGLVSFAAWLRATTIRPDGAAP